MKAKVDTLKGYEDMKTDSDSLALIQGIKDIVFDVGTQNKYKPQATHEAMRRFYMFKQDKFMDNSSYLEKFRTIVEVCEATGAEVGAFRSLAEDIIRAAGEDPDMASADDIEAATILGQDQYQAVAFLLLSDRVRYGKMLEDLQNGYLKGDTDIFPTIVRTQAIRELVARP